MYRRETVTKKFSGVHEWDKKEQRKKHSKLEERTNLKIQSSSFPAPEHLKLGTLNLHCYGFSVVLEFFTCDSLFVLAVVTTAAI